MSESELSIPLTSSLSSSLDISPSHTPTPSSVPSDPLTVPIAVEIPSSTTATTTTLTDSIETNNKDHLTSTSPPRLTPSLSPSLSILNVHPHPHDSSQPSTPIVEDMTDEEYQLLGGRMSRSNTFGVTGLSEDEEALQKFMVNEDIMENVKEETEEEVKENGDSDTHDGIEKYIRNKRNSIKQGMIFTSDLHNHPTHSDTLINDPFATDADYSSSAATASALVIEKENRENNIRKLYNESISIVHPLPQNTNVFTQMAIQVGNSKSTASPPSSPPQVSSTLSPPSPLSPSSPSGGNRDLSMANRPKSFQEKLAELSQLTGKSVPSPRGSNGINGGETSALTSNGNYSPSISSSSPSTSTSSPPLTLSIHPDTTDRVVPSVISPSSVPLRTELLLAITTRGKSTLKQTKQPFTSASKSFSTAAPTPSSSAATPSFLAPTPSHSPNEKSISVSTNSYPFPSFHHPQASIQMNNGEGKMETKEEEKEKENENEKEMKLNIHIDEPSSSSSSSSTKPNHSIPSSSPPPSTPSKDKDVVIAIKPPLSPGEIDPDFATFPTAHPPLATSSSSSSSSSSSRSNIYGLPNSSNPEDDDILYASTLVSPTPSTSLPNPLPMVLGAYQRLAKLVMGEFTTNGNAAVSQSKNAKDKEKGNEEEKEAMTDTANTVTSVAIDIGEKKEGDKTKEEKGTKGHDKDGTEKKSKDDSHKHPSSSPLLPSSPSLQKSKSTPPPTYSNDSSPPTFSSESDFLPPPLPSTLPSRQSSYEHTQRPTPLLQSSRYLAMIAQIVPMGFPVDIVELALLDIKLGTIEAVIDRVILLMGEDKGENREKRAKELSAEKDKEIDASSETLPPLSSSPTTTNGLSLMQRQLSKQGEKLAEVLWQCKKCSYINKVGSDSLNQENTCIMCHSWRGVVVAPASSDTNGENDNKDQKDPQPWDCPRCSHPNRGVISILYCDHCGVRRTPLTHNRFPMANRRHQYGMHSDQGYQEEEEEAPNQCCICYSEVWGERTKKGREWKKREQKKREEGEKKENEQKSVFIEIIDPQEEQKEKNGALSSDIHNHKDEDKDNKEKVKGNDENPIEVQIKVEADGSILSSVSVSISPPSPSPLPTAETEAAPASEEEESDIAVPFRQHRYNCHYFCSTCYKGYLQSKINDANVLHIRCPGERCQERIRHDEILYWVEDDPILLQKYVKFHHQATLSLDPLVRWCPTPGCESHMKGGRWTKKLTCDKCHESMCFTCNQPWHQGKSCKAVASSSLLLYKLTHDVKCCPHCQSPVERNEGCNHMTCAMCQNSWCWMCGGKYTENHFEPWNLFGCPGLQANCLTCLGDDSCFCLNLSCGCGLLGKMKRILFKILLVIAFVIAVVGFVGIVLPGMAVYYPVKWGLEYCEDRRQNRKFRNGGRYRVNSRRY